MWMIVLQTAYMLLWTNYLKNPSWALLPAIFRLCLFYSITWYRVPTLAVTQIHELKKQITLALTRDRYIIASSLSWLTFWCFSQDCALMFRNQLHLSHCRNSREKQSATYCIMKLSSAILESIQRASGCGPSTSTDGRKVKLTWDDVKPCSLIEVCRHAAFAWKWRQHIYVERQ
jgi:hypothetical protein